MLAVECLVEGNTTATEVSGTYLLSFCLRTFRWNKNKRVFFYFKEFVGVFFYLSYVAFDLWGLRNSDFLKFLAMESKYITRGGMLTVVVYQTIFCFLLYSGALFFFSSRG